MATIASADASVTVSQPNRQLTVEDGQSLLDYATAFNAGLSDDHKAAYHDSLRQALTVSDPEEVYKIFSKHQATILVNESDNNASALTSDVSSRDIPEPQVVAAESPLDSKPELSQQTLRAAELLQPHLAISGSKDIEVIREVIAPVADHLANIAGFQTTTTPSNNQLLLAGIVIANLVLIVVGGEMTRLVPPPVQNVPTWIGSQSSVNITAPGTIRVRVLIPNDPNSPQLDNMSVIVAGQRGSGMPLQHWADTHTNTIDLGLAQNLNNVSITVTAAKRFPDVNGKPNPATNVRLFWALS